MKQYDIIGGLFFLATGLFFSVYSRSVDIGSMQEPGPGFLPFWGGIIMIFMSLALIGKSWYRKFEKGEPFFPEPDSWKRITLVVAALIMYNVLLRLLGFTLDTFLFVAFLVKYIFPQSWLKTVTSAALSTIGAWLIFVYFLEITFPKGLFGF